MSSWATGGASVISTDSEPTWSAIVGMIGSALGCSRGDALLGQLSEDFGLAFKVHRAGVKEFDFNTVQSPNASQAKTSRPRTRAQELGFDNVDDLRDSDPNTSIIKREYLHGGHFTIYVVQLCDHPVRSLQEIAEALKDPYFPLAAGRRSCLIGKVLASIVNFSEHSDDLTHWDHRISMDRKPSLVRERRDHLLADSKYRIRLECVA